MDLDEIRRLVQQYRIALEEELADKRLAESMRTEILASAIIDGKNAEARKRQAESVLFQSDQYQVARERSERTEVERRAIDAEISLTKAWLYSQSGH